MSIVAGVDFGTLSVRVSIFDSERGRLGAGMARVSAAPQEGRSRSRHAEPRRPHAGAGRRRCARRSQNAGIDGSAIEAIALDTTGSSVIPVDAQLAAARRLLPLVRSSRLEGSRRDHGGGARAAARSDRLVRRRLLLRVGLREAAALAAPQSRKARPLGHGARALRHGGGDALRHHRSGGRAAQRLRHGPQVDVECRRSAACRRRSS